MLTYKNICKLYCILLIYPFVFLSNQDVIHTQNIMQMYEFDDCIFTKWKNTECYVNVIGYNFNLTNCDYDIVFWNLCDCCPKSTLLGNKLKNSFCPYEGVLDTKTRCANITANCGSELFQPY